MNLYIQRVGYNWRKVVKFKSDKKIIIPHVGWNKINLNEKIYKKSVLSNNTNNNLCILSIRTTSYPMIKIFN